MCEAQLDEYADRKRMTFEQAEGVEPLPSQLQLGELSPELRARLWRVVYEDLQAELVPKRYSRGPWLGPVWKTVLYNQFTLREHQPADEFDDEAAEHIERLKSLFMYEGYVSVLGFVQHALRNQKVRYNQFAERIARELEISGAAYRLLDDQKTIIPRASDAEAAAVTAAFAATARTEFQGARAHLNAAAAALTEGDYAGSVRESIHAVEAVARVLEPSAKTLEPALAALEKVGYVHPALKLGFSKLYGYANDEQGVRHALLDKTSAKVDESDALYVLGSCAAFVTYLVNKAEPLLSDRRAKAKQAGLPVKK